jgi:hypothetical protein
MIDLIILYYIIFGFICLSLLIILYLTLCLELDLLSGEYEYIL